MRENFEGVFLRRITPFLRPALPDDKTPAFDG